MLTFEEYAKNMPLVHSWDGGKTWTTGGFDRNSITSLVEFFKRHAPSSPSIIETGAGNSTIGFLFLHPSRLISIAPDEGLFARISNFCHSNQIDDHALSARIDGSEWVLPQIATEHKESKPLFDIALIDGCHNWPMVFLDFCYVNYLLKPSGYLILDDTQLHSVKELGRFLYEGNDYRLAFALKKSLVFQKTSERRVLEEWTKQPYITRRSRQYEECDDRFALYPKERSFPRVVVERFVRFVKNHLP